MFIAKNVFFGRDCIWNYITVIFEGIKKLLRFFWIIAKIKPFLTEATVILTLALRNLVLAIESVKFFIIKKAATIRIDRASAPELFVMLF